MHPMNALLRFLLELAALIALGYWGYDAGGMILGGGLILIFALAWGIFNVPGDPSRSGRAPVVVSGIVRLIIEALTFLLAVLGLFVLGMQKHALLLAGLVVIHYSSYWSRVRWLLHVTSGS